MSFIEHKTYKYYPKYISTLILCDYITKHFNNKEDGSYYFNIDGLLFHFYLVDEQIAECFVTKNSEYYDYFCRDYFQSKLKI